MPDGMAVCACAVEITVHVIAEKKKKTKKAKKNEKKQTKDDI